MGPRNLKLVALYHTKVSGFQRVFARSCLPSRAAPDSTPAKKILASEFWKHFMDSWRQHEVNPSAEGMLFSCLLHSTYSDFGLFQANGIDPDLAKMAEHNLTDKQRALVLKLSETRRELASLRSQVDASEDDQKAKSIKSKSAQLEKVYQEADELEESLARSLGQSKSESSRKRFQELDEQFNPDGETDRFTDEVSGLKVSDYPDIPTLGSSENLESVRRKLNELYDLRRATTSKMQNGETGENLAGSDDEEIDPLDAFMAETSLELAKEEVGKAEAKLVAINSAINQFEKLLSVLSENQFTDASISRALEQQKNLVHKKPRTSSEPEPPQSSRGKGTVWEEEFRKDESVPQRTYVDNSTGPKKTINVKSQEVRLNVNVGGLQVPGTRQTSLTSHEPSSAGSEKRQQELRKKLGY